MHALRDNPPNAELVVGSYFDLAVVLIVWDEPYALVLGIKLILFERKLAIYARYHEVTIAGLQSAIYYHDVTIAYACI